MDPKRRMLFAVAAGSGPLNPERASGLADLVATRADALSSGRPGWIWWKIENAGALDGWLLCGRAYAVLTGAFEANPEHPDAGGWAAACDILEALGENRSSVDLTRDPLAHRRVALVHVNGAPRPWPRRGASPPKGRSFLGSP